MSNPTITLPWYQQFWPWFLIALPAAAVIASFITLYIAASGTNDLVVESYYKKGKAINIDLSLVEQAKQLDINANILASADHYILDINLPLSYQNQPLKIALAHRTLAAKDLNEVVTADANGQYRFGHDLESSGRWFLVISPMDDSWRLQEQLDLPLQHERIDGQ